MEVDCPTCEGTGYVQKKHKIILRSQTPSWVSQMPNTNREVCSACEGHGRIERSD